MLIYLDAMIVQYIADYQDFIFQDIILEHNVPNPVGEPKFAAELEALRRLAFLEQFGHWDFAVPAHLMHELLSGKPTRSQSETYGVLSQAWRDSISLWNAGTKADEKVISSIEDVLALLTLQHRADRRHLAEAIALGACWFLTNDRNIISRTRLKQDELRDLTDGIELDDPRLAANQMLRRMLEMTKVARPSECVEVTEGDLSLV
jgi:hypothetical protein